LIEVISGRATPAELRRLHQAHPARYPFLLQSTASGNELGRYDILFAFPGDSLVLDRRAGAPSTTTAANGFLRSLDASWTAARESAGSSDLPFTGGWFLYLGYELASEIEPALQLGTDPLLPTAFATRCPAALIYDHARATCQFVHEAHDENAWQQVLHDLAEAREPREQAAVAVLSVSEEEAARFTQAVVAAKEYIAEGDVYQANLSREWRARLAPGVDGNAVYTALCGSNPAPFAGIARWQDLEIISSSPERLLSIRDGVASTRPIAGTRPRSADGRIDDDLSAELLAHPKERAEHIMLIDLERNDLGRVCVPGSVEVNEMMVLESYAHVHHIVSNIRGKLRDDVTPGAAIAAVFPGGTITGCPKVRCMQIIDELESGTRGAYTGAFGYLNLNGDLDLNILIRTIVKQGDNVSFRAGSGIVADSEPLAELEETRAKAKGLLGALSA